LRPALNDVLENVKGSTSLTGPCRNLGIHNDRICLIDLPRPDPKLPGRMLDYVKGPRWTYLADVEEDLAAIRIYILNQEGPRAAALKDEDLLSLAESKAELKRLEKEIKRRDARFNAILPILRKKGERELLSALEVLNDKALTVKIKKAAKKSNRSATTIYNLLHRYWAGGSTRNALFTAYKNCGCPGKSKSQNNSLGRKSRAYVAKRTTERCYPLDRGKGPDSEKDPLSEKQKLAWGWRLIKHGYSRQDAFIAVSGVFWSDHVVGSDGRTRSVLWNPHLRPTFSQFCTWGPKLNGGMSVTEMILGARKWAMKTEARGGSEQDMVVAVGQLAGFDGTKTDVYLSSVHSRLKKLPPMLRLVIKDVRTGVICGWYLGWDSASPRTAQQAIFHAASSKVEECRRLGIQITDDVIPAILHKSYLADNGELKAEAITEFEEQFGIGINYVSAGRGDKKGGIESQHHKDHKKLDHVLPGSTGGKPRERGDDHPALGGFFNSYEYRREFMHLVIENNNEEVPDLAPAEMEISDPELRPTRINIFNWLRRRQTAEAPRDIDALRAYALPDVEAVIRKNGIYPLLNVLGTKVLLPRLRFAGAELVATGLLAEVKRTGKTQPVRIKLDQSNPDKGWLPTKAGLIPLTCASRRESIRNKLTLADWVSSHEDRLLARDAGRGARDQARLDTLERRKSTELNARSEFAAESKAAGNKPSKAELTRNIDQNLVDELAESAMTSAAAAIAPRSVTRANRSAPSTAQHGKSSVPPKTAASIAPQAAARPAMLDLADIAMSSLNDDEF